MNAADMCGALRSGIEALLQCEDHGEFIRIRTPYLYPDGDNIDVFCKPQDELILVTDLAETTRWLRSQTLAPRRSPKQKALIDDACLTHGVEFYRGMLMARCHTREELPVVVTRVAQAALRVSDVWFTFRTRSVESVTDEVSDFLVEREFGFERGEKLTGRSGRIWTPDFHVRTVQRSSLVYVLSTGSRSAARSVVSQVHTAFYDLNHLVAGPEAMRFVSLFDDTADVWSDEDFRLAEQLSTVTRWSQPDEFADALVSA
ncbi:MAG: DUF1828 domain-containing protein [Spirochaetaceae bacterium]|nr:MAG: DUF1828 domain-containing protein [Spirochaetaceae bacterium]